MLSSLILDLFADLPLHADRAFLALLVGMVLLCTLLEAWVIFYNNNFAAPAASSHGRIEDTEAAFVSIAEYKSATIVYENSAYEPDKADNSE